MDKIKLKNISSTGKPLVASFLPGGGMNLCSYKLGDIEVIDQKTLPFYEKRRGGLGALIGPHFHERQDISIAFDETLFPHIATGKREGRKDPFSHGIARYVPWKYVASETQIRGRLSGDDLYKGIPLKIFEGQNFLMTFEAHLLSNGLFIEYKIDSEKPSLVGLHYYYSFSGKGTIHGAVQPTYRDQDQWKPLPEKWKNGKKNHLHFTLPQEADFGFLPEKKTANDHDYQIILDTRDYSLHIEYNTVSDSEISCQIYQPRGCCHEIVNKKGPRLRKAQDVRSKEPQSELLKEKSDEIFPRKNLKVDNLVTTPSQKETFVCIEPLSARFPPKPKLKRSILEAKLEIFSPLHPNND